MSRGSLLAKVVLIILIIGLSESASGDTTFVSGGSYTSDITWDASHSPYVILGDITVTSGKQLTIRPGVMVLFQSGAGLNIGGTSGGSLTAVGAVDSLIVFSAYSGETNGWDGIFFTNYALSSTLRHCVVEKAGQSGWSGYSGNVICWASVVTIDSSVIRDATGYGLNNRLYSPSISHTQFSNNGTGIFCDGTSPTVHGCQFLNNQVRGIYLVGNAFPNLSDNSYSGNPIGISVASGNLSTNGTWYCDNGEPYVIYGDVFVSGGSRLTIRPGTTVLFQSGAGLQTGTSSSYGALTAVGTADSLIVFSAYSGVTNGWDGVRFTNYTSSSTLGHCVVEKAGQNGWTQRANVCCDWTNAVTIDSCVIREAAGNGIYCNYSAPIITYTEFSGDSTGIHCNISSPVVHGCQFLNNTNDGLRVFGVCAPVVTQCTFQANSLYPIRLLEPWSSVRESGGTFAGNGIEAIAHPGGSNLYGYPASVRNVTFHAATVPYRLLSDLSFSNSSVYNTPVLTIEPGVTIACDSGVGISFNTGNYPGVFSAAGTSDSLITFTSWSGQTNGWDGIKANGGSSLSMQYCVVEKAGQNGWGKEANLYCNLTPATIIDCQFVDGKIGAYCTGCSPAFTSCTFENNANYGLFLTGASTATIALSKLTSNGLAGIYIGTGTLVIGDSQLLRCDLYGNGSYEVYNNSTNDVYARCNYWGTSDSNAIATRIFDHSDDPSKGIVLYTDFIRNHNVAVMGILSPVGMVPANVSILPAVVVQNSGLNSESGSLVFGMEGTGYAEAVPIQLEAGQMDTVTFSQWLPTHAAGYRVVAELSVQGDENPSDNRLEASVFVSSGVGPEIHALSPATVVSGTVSGIMIIGQGFQEGMTARLLLAGEQDIVADTSNVTFVADTQIVATFDLTGAVTDRWDIQVTTAGNESFRFYDGLNVVFYDGDLLPYCEWQDFIVHDGSSIEIGGVAIGKTNDTYMLLKKSNRIGYCGTWAGDVAITNLLGDTIAFASGGADVAFHLQDLPAGLYELNVRAFDPGEGEVQFCSQLPDVTLGSWYIGEILRPYGYDWVQFDVPESQDTLFVETEGFGLWSTIEVYRDHLTNFPQRWMFSNPGQGYHIVGKIVSPPAGRYYLRYMDSAVLYDNPDDQRRDYMLWVDVQPAIPPDTTVPVITGLSTYEGGQGPVTVIVSGQGFDTSASAFLFRDGFDSVTAQYAYSDSTGSILRATFDLSAAETGAWRFIVMNPSGLGDTASGDFQVVGSSESSVWVRIKGRALARVGRMQLYVVEYGNDGNTDAPGVPIWITGFPEGTTIDLLEEIHSIPIEGDTMDWANTPPYFVDDGGMVIMPLILQNVPTKYTGQLTLRVLLPSDASQFTMTAWTSPAMYYAADSTGSRLLAGRDWASYMPRPEVFECITSIISISLGFVNPTYPCFLEVWDSVWKLGAEAFYHVRVFNHVQMYFDLLRKCSTFSAQWMNSAKAYFSGLVSGLWMDESCQEAFPGPSGESAASITVTQGQSSTPEDKYGRTGFDLAGTPPDSLFRFTASSRSTYDYRIDFWNDTSANAAAQIVTVRDTLDAGFDLTSFGFTEVGFLKYSVPLDGTQYFDVNVDMRPEKDLIVNVEGTFDPDHRAIEWNFVSLDPTTMEPIEPSSTNGFLDPIDSTGYQIGWVDFTVDPLSGLASGTQITNQAFVNFDSIPACDTCPYWSPAPKERPWLNTIDASAPITSVSSLDSVTAAREFEVTWGGSDSASGIKAYSVYYSKNGEPYQPWLIDTIITSAIFPDGIGDRCQHGDVYRVYSVSEDWVGYVEAPPDSFDTYTRIEYDFICGDVDGTATINIADLTYLIAYLFRGGPPPPMFEAADVTCDSTLNISDLTYLVAYLFRGGPEPCADCTYPALVKRVSPHKGVCVLKTEPVEGGGHKVVVNGDYETELGGFQQRYEYAERLITVDSVVAGPDHSAIAVYYQAKDGQLDYGMIDITGQHLFRKGKAVTAEIYFHLAEGVTLSDSLLSHTFTIAVDKNALPLQLKVDDAQLGQALPRAYRLHQNYPNPFNAETVIKYDLPKPSKVTIRIYNILGQQVTRLVDEHQPAGYHEVTWNATNSSGKTVATGVYFYQIEAENFTDSKKMLLLK